MRNPLKCFCLAVIVICILTLSFQSVLAEPGNLVLKKDMRGEEVLKLQKDLKQLGFFSQNPTGYYGDITKVAVIDFQKQHGLAADGIAGTGTLEKISSLLKADKSTTVLKKGMNNPDVKAIQRDLRILGFFTPGPTGYFGDATEAAVIQFQKKNGITPDGKIGANTRAKIKDLVAKADRIKIVIDPGHGGIDVGTSKGNVVESEVNLSISKKLKAYLEDYGYEAVLTRSKDVALDSHSGRGDTRQERDLNVRTNIINESGADLFVSIHVNSLPDSPSTSGSIVYYNDKISKSRELARSIQKALNGVTASNYKRKAQNSRKADYYVLRNSDVPGVLVETAFITNKKERELLATDAFRDKLAKAILEGIENYK